ncbi:hypothetical protein AGIG_G13316 [Arapaima gigas]
MPSCAAGDVTAGLRSDAPTPPGCFWLHSTEGRRGWWPRALFLKTHTVEQLKRPTIMYISTDLKMHHF